MRILLISHPPLTAELGAAQLTLRLADALRDLGHDAEAWSPAPVPPGRGGFRRRQTEVIERYVSSRGPYDVVDTPVTSASPGLARSALLVVRSIQPELLYLRAELAQTFRRPRPSSLLWALGTVPVSAAIIAGWRRAHLILCLGSLELAWMRHRFPDWSGKLGLWTPAVAENERAALAAIRTARPAFPAGQAGEGVRFLWIGRWSAHKGIRRLRRFLATRLAAFPADTCTLAGCGLAAGGDLPRAWLASGRVRLVPSFARAELPALLSAHDAGLFTSEVEGWGLTLNEMLESGMPVYATDAGGAPDLQPYFPGALRPFPPPHGAALDPAPRQSLVANGYLARFAWPAVAKEWERQVLAASMVESGSDLTKDGRRRTRSGAAGER